MGYYHRWIYSGMGKYTFKFHLLWRRRLLPDRTKQYFCHHPYAGIRTNGHLFPVYIRLSGPASCLCRRLCLDSISYIPVLFIGLGSLFFPQLTLFIPLYWIGAYGFQALTPKSFFSSLVGWTLPYWFLLGHAYFYDEMDLFYQPFIELATFHPINLWDFPLWEIATLGYLFVLYLVSSIHCLVAGYEDKIRTRSYLHFLIFLSFCIFVYILLQPVLTVHLLPLLLIGVSILTGHFVVLTNSRASNVFFICALAGLILLFGFNIWTLL